MRILGFVLFILYAHPAYAYIGPGAGLSLIGSFFALVFGIGIALFAIVLWPLRRLLKKRKEAKKDH